MEVNLTGLTCADCGCAFGISDHYMAMRRNDHRDFYCPNGHVNVYNARSEAERLSVELERLKDRHARVVADRDQLEASNRGLKGANTRLKNQLSST